MPDCLGCYDEDVEERIKMAYNVNTRPKPMVRPTFPPVKKPKPEYEYIDEETELTKEITEAARKAGIVTEDMDVWEQDSIYRQNKQRLIIEAIRENLPKPSPPKNVVIKGSGWMGPG